VKLRALITNGRIFRAAKYVHALANTNSPIG
jgi:hypothetical protein